MVLVRFMHYNYGRGGSGRPARSQPKIEIGIFFRPDLNFASRSGSPNLLEVGMKKSG